MTSHDITAAFTGRIKTELISENHTEAKERLKEYLVQCGITDIKLVYSRSTKVEEDIDFVV